MKTIERVLEVLKAEGFQPALEEYGIAFKYQMMNFLYLEDENDENFFQLVIPYIYEVNEENELDVLRAINASNRFMKVTKMVINSDDVWVGYEALITSDTRLEEMVPTAIVTLSQARQKFYTALKEG